MSFPRSSVFVVIKVLIALLAILALSFLAAQRIGSLDIEQRFPNEDDSEANASSFGGNSNQELARNFKQENKRLSALDELKFGELEKVFIDSSVSAFEDETALDLASRTLQRIAEEDPAVAVSMLYALPPFLREKMATDMARGWAVHDPLAVWDWIESAWIDEEGAFIDRALQNELSLASMGSLLDNSADLVLAATLTSLSNQPDLKESLAAMVAEYVVSEDPEEALTQFAFEGDQTVDAAIMNAVIERWAERDAEGAVEWTLDNLDQVSAKGVAAIAKQLVLVGEPSSLGLFYDGLSSAALREATASEAARMTARRNLVEASKWISLIDSQPAKLKAAESALYELGYDDLDSTILLVHLAFSGQEANRVAALSGALDEWVRQDRGAVSRFLASGQEPTLPSTVEEFVVLREGSN